MTVFHYCASLLIMFSSTGCIQAVTLEVNEGNSTCIKAELSASISITYNTSNSTVCTVTTNGFHLWKHWYWFNWLDHLSFLREKLRSLCPTLLQSIKAAAHVAQSVEHPGWWRCLDLATRWGWAFQPMEVCTVSLTWHCSTTSATLRSSLRPTALVRTNTAANCPAQRRSSLLLSVVKCLHRQLHSL